MVDVRSTHLCMSLSHVLVLVLVLVLVFYVLFFSVLF